MNTTRFLHAPELSRFEVTPHVFERLEDYFDVLQRDARRNGLPYTGDTLKPHALKTDILNLAKEQGFHFLDNSTVGVLYYEPLAVRQAHVDTRGRTLFVTTSGHGTYRQYPNTDEYRDRACLEIPISPKEAEHTKAVAEEYCLLANQSIPHSFHNGVKPRTAFYIAG